MKRLIPALVGITLFVVGYQYIRRQAAYVANQPTLQETAPTTPAKRPPSWLKNMFAFRMVKPA